MAPTTEQMIIVTSLSLDRPELASVEPSLALTHATGVALAADETDVVLMLEEIDAVVPVVPVAPALAREMVVVVPIVVEVSCATDCDDAKGATVHGLPANLMANW